MPGTDIRETVRAAYSAIAGSQTSCCGPASSGPDSTHLGYDKADLDLLPRGADLGLGCGNPNAMAALRPGERVLDLGSGAGIDVLLAAQRVGPSGRVIGVDMTQAMVEKARIHAVEAGFADRVDIREGFIEDLPVRDGEVDVILSNCVINLSPDKEAVFREAFRALAPGGRLAVSDILLTEPLPDAIAKNVASWVGCLAGAPVADVYLEAMADAGFVDIETTRTPAAALLQTAEAQVGIDLGIDAVERDSIAHTVFSYAVSARKPSA